MKFGFKSLFSFSLFVIASGLIFPVLSTPVDAGSCCFQPGANPEQCVSQCYTDRQVKNDCTGNGSDQPGGCHQCTGGLSATTCSGGGNSNNFCDLFGVTPHSTTVAVGQTAKITISVQKDTWDKVSILYGNAAIAKFSPLDFYGKSLANAQRVTQFLTTTVTGVKPGSVSVIAGQYATYPGYLNLYCQNGFAVNVVAAPPTPTPAPAVCIPGARCDVVGNGRVVAGSSIVCSMPWTTTPAGAASVSYEIQCNHISTTGVSTQLLSTTKLVQSTAPVTARISFDPFKFTQTTGKLSCSFRTCSSNSTTKVKTCTDWGK